jgi:hypothetical protein
MVFAIPKNFSYLKNDEISTESSKTVLVAIVRSFIATFKSSYLAHHWISKQFSTITFAFAFIFYIAHQYDNTLSTCCLVYQHTLSKEEYKYL